MKVDRDILSAYLDGVLSPDAERSLRQELGGNASLREALERERKLLKALDSLGGVQPPADFVNAVMGRVAQQPARRPAVSLPWREALRWGVATSLVLVVLLVAGLGWFVGSGALDNADLGGWAARSIAGGAELVAGGIHALRELTSPVRVLVEETGKLAWRLVELASASSWIFQLTLLLLTVSLNYAFTRLVANYQRRH